MINHSGHDISSGHYTSCCFDKTNGWVVYNDSHYNEMSEAEVERKAKDAYVLLYRRKWFVKCVKKVLCKSDL